MAPPDGSQEKLAPRNPTRLPPADISASSGGFVGHVRLRLRQIESDWIGWQGLAPNVRGAILVLFSAILFTAMATLAKLLGTRLDSFQVVFFRTLTGLIFILPFLYREGRRGLRFDRLGLHLARGIFGNIAMICGFYALIHLPLADANAITFARALFVVPLAMIFLGEVVGTRRLTATAIGFLGVLIMLRPTGTVEPAALAAVGQAVFVAVTVICVKILSRTNSPVALLTSSAIIGLVITTIPAIAVWQTPTWNEFGLLLLMGAFGVTAQNCFIRAYSVGEATAMAPFDYTRLLFAAVAGYFVFAHVPDIWTVTGAAIIVATTLYIARREAQLGRVEPTANEQDISSTDKA